MEPLDGNAVAGDLYEYYGEEMTPVSGTCRHCRARSVVAELRVYLHAPGVVVRCPSCGSPVMVVLTVEGATRVYSDGFRFDNAA